jgi:Leucine-rich repeat (LRR) protein
MQETEQRQKEKKCNFEQLSFDVFGYIMGFMSSTDKIRNFCLVNRKWYEWTHMLPICIDFERSSKKYDVFLYESKYEKWRKIEMVDLRFPNRSSKVRTCDISFLRRCNNLKVLMLSNTQLANADFVIAKVIESCPYIKVLCLEHIRVANLPNEAEYKFLEELSLKCTQVSDINFIEHCVGLRILNLSRVNIDNISSLRFCNVLEELTIDCTMVIDISPLVYCTKLKILSMSGTEIDNIDSLRKCADLEVLKASRTKICKIDVLGEGCNKLKKLDLRRTSVRDISSLEKCLDLEEVLLNFTSVVSLVSLTNHKKIKRLGIACGEQLLSIKNFISYETLEELHIGCSEVLDDKLLDDFTHVKINISYGHVDIISLVNCTNLDPLNLTTDPSTL